MIILKKEVGIEIKEDQADMEDDTDEKETDNVNLDDYRDCHWKMVFEENDGGVNDNKALLHDKKWDVYVNKKETLIKGGYLMEVVDNDGKKVILEVQDDHVAEETTDHDEIGLRGFDFNFFDEEEKGVG